MRYLLTIIILLLGIFIFSSCEQSIKLEQLQFRNYLAYEVNFEKPYSGKALDYFGDDDKKIKSEWHFTEGTLESCSFYFENGQKSIQQKYENRILLEEKVYFENGQLDHEMVVSDGKLVRMSRYFESGEKEFSIENDPNFDIVKFNFLKKNNEIDKTGYYLNAKIFPMMTFLEMCEKSPNEILGKFGKVNVEGEQQDLMVSYAYKFYRAGVEGSISADEGIILANKAAIWYNYFKHEDGSLTPRGSVQITYYNKTKSERDEILTETENYFIAHGFVKIKKNEFKYDKFIMSRISLNNNISYQIAWPIYY